MRSASASERRAVGWGAGRREKAGCLGGVSEGGVVRTRGSSIRVCFCVHRMLHRGLGVVLAGEFGHFGALA